MGQTAADCLIQGFISTARLPYRDIPNELQIFRNAYLDIRRISNREPYSVTDGNCLNDCKGAAICTDELAEYYRQIPTVFNQSIYGPDCALELGQKRKELKLIY